MRTNLDYIESYSITCVCGLSAVFMSCINFLRIVLLLYSIIKTNYINITHNPSYFFKPS